MGRRLAHNGPPYEEAFSYKTDIFLYTTLYDGKNLPELAAPGWRCEPWERALADLQSIYTRREGDADSAAFEREGYEVLRPLLEPAFEKGVASWPRLEDRPYGFFTQNVTDTWLPGQTVIGLHFGNPFAPASPLADLPERARELRRLVDDVTREWEKKNAEGHASAPSAAFDRLRPPRDGRGAEACPGPGEAGTVPIPCEAGTGTVPVLPKLETIGTGSWLNSVPPFTTLFPPEWLASAKPFPKLVQGKGWWGQFIDRRGGYHRPNGDYLRRTGRFPYPVLNFTCSIDSLRRHLKERFGVE